ncbi:MAG: hypothetical protein WBJ54_09115 [Syntrophorhabdus sp.]|nr:hypothetical protein [Syntrophorhabdus sp.]
MMIFILFTATLSIGRFPLLPIAANLILFTCFVTHVIYAFPFFVMAAIFGYSLMSHFLEGL